MEGVYYYWDATHYAASASPENFYYHKGEQFRATSFWLGRCSDANQPEEEAA